MKNNTCKKQNQNLMYIMLEENNIYKKIYNN